MKRTNENKNDLCPIFFISINLSHKDKEIQLWTQIPFTTTITVTLTSPPDTVIAKIDRKRKGVTV